jgi:phosphatidylglycerophosphate synthase
VAGSERRPLKTRDRAVFQRLASGMAARRVPPNVISASSILFAAAAGACLVGTTGSNSRLLFVLAAVFVQLRLLANMLDGMVALSTGESTPLGDMWNEVPDRFADVMILVGAGYAVGGSIELGFVASMLALLTAYLRAFGATHGVSGLFLGPMAKPHRMAAVTVACLWAALVPVTFPGGIGHELGAMTIALWLIVAGAIVTVVRRLNRIASALSSRS